MASRWAPRAGAARRAGTAPAPLVALAATAAAALAGGGCGARAPDLFLIQRTGSQPGATITLVISDNGDVRCPGGRTRRLSDPELLAARQYATDLAKPSSQGVSLPPGPNSVFSYTISGPGGRVRFSDTSRGAPSVLLRLAGFTAEVARQVCALPS